LQNRIKIVIPTPERSLKTVAFAYDACQDRILAIINGSGPEGWACWLTRKLVLQVLQAVPSYIATSSPLAARVPADHQLELAKFEREAAIASTSASMIATPAEPIQRSAVAAELATRLTISTQGEGFCIDLQGQGGGRAVGPVGRSDLQRILQMLEHEGARAEWLIAFPAVEGPESGIHIRQ
jgi:hypothetical protein